MTKFNNNMKIKNASANNGFKLETKKSNDNQYRKKLDSLVPGNVLLPDSSSAEALKLRSIRPPIKNVRVPLKIHYTSRFFPQIHKHPDQNNDKKNEFSADGMRENHRVENMPTNAKKNVELLDHMIDILRNKEEKHLAPIRINTEPESFNQFTNLENSTSKNSRGPLIDPKMSKFYDKKYFRRQIFSQEKRRNINSNYVQNPRLSVSKNYQGENLNLMTFYNHGQNEHKQLPIKKIENLENQFM